MHDDNDLDPISIARALDRKQGITCQPPAAFVPPPPVIVPPAPRPEPAVAERRAEFLSKAEGVFKVAGFRDFFFKEIPNEYWPHTPDYQEIAESNPWLLVATEVGIFKFGWRKRVLVLEWDRTVIQARAETIFPGEDVTKYDRGIHAWGYEKAIQYLTRLRNACV